MSRGTASIVIRSQDGTAGSAGRSRDDLVLSEVVTCYNADNQGVTTWRWQLLDRPTDSTVVLSDPTGAQISFTPDEYGTYLLQLTVNQGQRGQVAKSLVVCRDGSGLRYPAFGETDEANWLVSGQPNTRGWLPDLELLFDSAGGSVILPTNSLGGRTTAGTGAIEAISVSSPLTLAGLALGLDQSNLNVNNQGRTVYSYNWETLATTANFADGNVVMGDRTWVSASGSAAALWRNLNGTGLQWTPATGGAGTRSWTAITANTNTSTAPWLRITLGDLIGSSYDPAARYSFEIRYSGYTTGNANRLYFGLYRAQDTPIGAALNCRMAAIYVASGPHPAAGVLPNGTISGNDAITLGASGTLGLTVEPNGSAMVYSGGTWPALSDGVFNYTTTLGDVPLQQRADTFLVISSSMNVAATPTAAWNIHEIRVRRV